LRIGTVAGMHKRLNKTIITALACAGALSAHVATAAADSSVSRASDGAAVYFGDQNKGEILQAWTQNGYVYFEDDFQTITTNGVNCNAIGTHQVRCLIDQDLKEVRIHG